MAVQSGLSLADLRARRDKIERVARNRGAHNLRVFGSVARGEARADSDVDFLVDFEPGRTVLDLSEWRTEVSMLYTRITVDALQMGGIPCIRGLRIPVATVIGMLADGLTETEILEAYPDLEQDDIRQALRYAAEATREREIPVLAVS